MYDIKKMNSIFQEAIKKYHIEDSVNQDFVKPDYEESSFEYLLYKKCWIDTVQWHYEDIIRDPEIKPEDAIIIKRKIDKSNQERTDLVEVIDDFIYEQIKGVSQNKDARINTESAGWAIDRLSILNLKVYHWQEETERKDADIEHIQKAKNKLSILQTQYHHLSIAIEQLLKDLLAGNVIAPTFKQMKMYNDPETNPVLRASKQNSK